MDIGERLKTLKMKTTTRNG